MIFVLLLALANAGRRVTEWADRQIDRRYRAPLPVLDAIKKAWLRG